VVTREGADVAPEHLRAHLEGMVAKWWIPERFEFLEEVPKTSVGKFDKKLLRARCAPSEASVGPRST
jgi:fatty-acyl-CoA synthase